MITRELVEGLVELADAADEAGNEKHMERVVAFLADRISTIQEGRRGVSDDMMLVIRARARERLRMLELRAGQHEEKLLRERLPEDLRDEPEQVKIHWLRIFRATFADTLDIEVAMRAAGEAARRIQVRLSEA